MSHTPKFVVSTPPRDSHDNKTGYGYADLGDDAERIDASPAAYVIKSEFLRQLFAEFLGTFVMVSFSLGTTAQVTLSDGTAGNFETIAFSWGVAVLMGLTTAGVVSGGHLNSMITTSLVLLKMFPLKKVPGFIHAQTLGSFMAAVVVYVLYRPLLNVVDPDHNATHGIFATYPHENVSNLTALLTKIFAGAMFVFVILALLDTHNRPTGTHAAPAGIAVCWCYVGIILHHHPGNQHLPPTEHRF